MNPTPKPATNYNTVTLQNCDTVDFEIIYDNQSYGIIPPGGTKQMPGFLAEHALKHLLDQILNHLNLPTTNMAERDKWSAKCVIGEIAMAAPVSLSEREKLAREMEELNKSDLQRTMKNREVPDEEGMLPEIDEDKLDTLPAENPPVGSGTPPPVDPPPAPTPPLNPPAAIAEAPQPAASAPPPQQEGPAPLAPDPELIAADNPGTPVPTRQELYDFARNTLKMDLNHKETMEKLENMSVPQIIDELQYYEQTGQA